MSERRASAVVGILGPVAWGVDHDALNPKGRGRETFAALFTGVLRCDTPRSYSVRVIRAER